MNVLVTGATGFLGWRTLEVLVKDSAVKSIIATGRTLKPTHTITHDKVRYILGNLENSAFVESLFDGIDCIVNTAALSSPWGNKLEFEIANVSTQKNLIESSIKHGVKRFVFISTPSLYFGYKDRFNVKEEDELPKKFVNQYAVTKRKAELLLIDSGLPYVILRPRAIIGRGDTVIMPRLIKAFDQGRLKIIGNGKNIADLTSVGNVANAILLSLKSKGPAVNQTYNITNGAPVVLWDSIFDVLKRLDKKAPTKKVSLKVVRFIARILEFKSKMTDNLEPSLTQYGAGTLAISLTMDISKAQKLLGYMPKVSTQDALVEFVKWYKKDE